MRVLVVGGMCALFVLTIAIVHADDSGGSSEVPDCIQYWGEARYDAYGYDHVVHVANGCESAAACRVSTNVNPDWQDVEVAAGDKAEVVTYIGSPSREFTPYVRCRLEQ